MGSVTILGAGLGGLAAAVELAAAGVQVTLVEAAGSPGGKAGVQHISGASFDTGPSVFTLPDVLEGLLHAAGTQTSEIVTLRAPDPAFRYLWPDGTQLLVAQNPRQTEQLVRQALGGDAAAEFSSFMDYSKRIWDAASPNFVLADAPTVAGIARLGPSGLRSLGKIDAFRSMWAAIQAHVRNPYLQDLFARFATYNGSDVRNAPATLNCIAHVEMGLGSYGIEGGVHALPVALADLATKLGADLRYGRRVQAIEADRGGIRGLVLEDGSTVASRHLVVNADVAHLVQDLLPRSTRHGLTVPPSRSTSGWTAVVKARKDPSRTAHTALFPSTYMHEFRDMFDRHRAPVEPTVYLCDQHRAHGRDGWHDHAPVFVMANAPSLDPRHTAVDEDLGERALGRARKSGLIHADDEVVWHRTPAGLASQFPGSHGALYGAASNSMFSAFQRPANRISRIPGLYLASGSAHPGGGMPLCIQSGRLAASAVLKDLGVNS